VPGGGKSSLVMAVASELRLSMYMLQLSSEQMSDETLNSLLQYGMHDPPTIVLLEDVDLLHSAVLHRHQGAEENELAEQRGEVEKHGKEHSERKRRSGRLTLSGLLNALDGPTATTGRLLFMTTNARERLDPALLRSGRIDYEVEFKEAEPEQIQRLFARFYSDFRSGAGGCGQAATAAAAGAIAAPVGAKVVRDADLEVGDGTKAEGTGSAAASTSIVNTYANTKELAVAFAKQVTASGVQLTSADIQRHLMKHKTDPKQALKELPSLARQPKEAATVPTRGRVVSVLGAFPQP